MKMQDTYSFVRGISTAASVCGSVIITLRHGFLSVKLDRAHTQSDTLEGNTRPASYVATRCTDVDTNLYCLCATSASVGSSHEKSHAICLRQLSIFVAKFRLVDKISADTARRAGPSRTADSCIADVAVRCVCFSRFIVSLFPENLSASAQTRPTTVGNKIRVSRRLAVKFS